MTITYQDMPERIRGLTVQSFDNGENYYTIILNARLSKEQQEQAYRHEMYHIENRDFESDLSLEEIERNAREHTNNR